MLHSTTPAMRQPRTSEFGGIDVRPSDHLVSHFYLSPQSIRSPGAVGRNWSDSVSVCLPRPPTELNDPHGRLWRQCCRLTKPVRLIDPLLPSRSCRAAPRDLELGFQRPVVFPFAIDTLVHIWQGNRSYHLGRQNLVGAITDKTPL